MSTTVHSPVDEAVTQLRYDLDLWPRRQQRWNGRCRYCGARCYGRTCLGHRDLPQIEQAVR